MFTDPMQTAHYLNLQNEMERVQGRANQQNSNNASLQGNISALQQENAKLKGENLKLSQLYNSEQELMAAWMVSQKGFKELALRFGFDKGLSQEEILQKAEETKLDVLDNKHDPRHGTNANGIPLIEEKAEFIREEVFTKLNIQPKKK